MKRRVNLVFLGALVAVGLLGFQAGQATATDTTTSKPYSGVEVQNLIDVVNNHATMLAQIQGDLGTICGKLNSDSGVGYTNFAPTNSGSNTFYNLVRR